MKQVKCAFRGGGTYIATGIFDSITPVDVTDSMIISVGEIEEIKETYGITDVFLRNGVVTIFDKEACTVLTAMRESYANC